MPGQQAGPPPPATGSTGEARPVPPGRLAVRVIELAMLALPKGDVRRRYERELIAELYGLPVRQQALFALSVLATARSLRRALQGSGLLREITMTTTTERLPLRCRLNLKHHWVWHFTDTTERYLVCSRCGREGRGRPPAGTTSGMIGTGTGGNC